MVVLLAALVGAGVVAIWPRGHARPAAPDPAGCARAVVAELGRAEQVDQLFMVGVTDIASVDSLAAAWRPGFVILDGRRRDGQEAVVPLTRHVTATLGTRQAAPMIAVDQEGGAVQALRGPGFSDLPSATDQGRMPPGGLQDAATGWGRELAAAGVTMNLAPVADVLSARLGDGNAAVGANHRTFSTDPAAVAEHAEAFAAGMAAAGVVPVLKHFPGLGGVAGNTDFTARVVDRDLDAGSPALQPYRAALGRRPVAVMLSTAVYERLDPTAPAAFSREVVAGLLRRDLGYDGVVLSDDIARAEQVSAIPVAERAVRFVLAGGDVVIAVDPAAATAMRDGLLARAGADPALAAAVAASATRVLALKARLGLVTCGR